MWTYNAAVWTSLSMVVTCSLSDSTAFLWQSSRLWFRSRASMWKLSVDREEECLVFLYAETRSSMLSEFDWVAVRIVQTSTCHWTTCANMHSIVGQHMHMQHNPLSTGHICRDRHCE